MRILLAILIMAVCVEMYGVTHTESIQNTRLRVSTQDASFSRALSRYADRCARNVDETLQCDAPPQRNVIISQESCAKGKQRELEFRFKDEADMLYVTSGIMRVLLLRRSRELFGKTASGPAVDYIAAALAYSFIMRMRMEGSFTDYDYQAALSQSGKGFVPLGQDLICHPMNPEMPWLYRLYAMHSSILMICFRTLNVNMSRMMLEAASKGNDIQNIYDNVVCKNLPAGASFQPWFESLAQQIILRDRGGTVMSGLDEKIAALETVSVVEAGNVIAELKPVKIDESKQSIEALRGDKAVLNKRQQEFLRLRNEAPVLVRPALEKYARAMGYLASDDVRSFKKELRQARKEYQAAAKKQARIEQALSDFEKEHTTPIRRFGTELEIIRHFHSLEEQLHKKQ